MGVTRGYLDQPFKLDGRHMLSKKLYGDLPKESDKVRKRRLQFVGHCVRSSEQDVSNLVLLKPMHGIRSVGRRIMTYVVYCVRTLD